MCQSYSVPEMPPLGKLAIRENSLKVLVYQALNSILCSGFEDMKRRFRRLQDKRCALPPLVRHDLNAISRRELLAGDNGG